MMKLLVVLLLILVISIIKCDVDIIDLDDTNSYNNNNDITEVAIDNDSIDNNGNIESNKESFTEPAYLSMTTIELLLKEGKPQHALLELEKYPLNYQKNVDYQLNLARTYVALNDVNKGEQILTMAIADNPTSINAIIAIIKLYIHQQRWSLAEKYIDMSKEIDQSSSSILALQGKLYLIRDNDHQKARKYLEQAILQNPNDEKIHFDLGMVLFHSNDYESGRKAFQVAESINNGIDHKVIGTIYMNFGMYDWAIEEFEKAINISHSKNQEQDIDTLLLLGQCKDVVGDLEIAISIYENVLLREPNNAVAHTAIGLILLGVGNSNYGAINACGLNQEEALSHLQLALKINPSIKPADEALSFCRKEFAEAKLWREHLKNSEASSSNEINDNSSIFDNIKKLYVKIKNPIGSIIEVLEHTYNSIILKFLKKDTEFCNIDRFTEIPIITTIFNKIQSLLCQPLRLLNSNSISNKKQRIEKNWKKRSMEMKSVSRITIKDSKDFYNLIDNNKPVIITNFQDRWASSDSFTKKGLVDQFGEYLVRVSVSESGRFDGPENGTLWGLGPNSDVLVRPPATSMLFVDVLTLMSQSNNKETFYLEYLALNQYLGNDFLNLIPIPSQVNTTDLKHLVTNLWIGSQPTISPLHYDDYENLLCQIKGRKEVILFPPNDHKNLYYIGRPKGTLQYTYPGQFIREKSKVEARSVVFGSSVNVDEPDDKRHPLYKKAHPIRALLEPSSCLYLPAYWHHEVQSIPDDIEGINVAVNFWFANQTSAPVGM